MLSPYDFGAFHACRQWLQRGRVAVTPSKSNSTIECIRLGLSGLARESGTRRAEQTTMFGGEPS